MTNPTLASLDAILPLLPPELQQRCTRPETWPGLSQTDARALANGLKEAADAQWMVDARNSSALADAIIGLGQAQDDVWIRALGTMAKGDATRFLGSQQQGWTLLETAAALFEQAGDPVGWARTWIGRMAVSVQLNRVPEALGQVDRMREIFAQHGELRRQIRLEMVLGELRWEVESPVAAEQHYLRALALAEAHGLGESIEVQALFNNLGLIAQTSGRPRLALQHHSRGLALAQAHQAHRLIVMYQLNIAEAHMRLGQNRQALFELRELQPQYEVFEPSSAELIHELARCNAALNRYHEAIALFEQARQRMLAADEHHNVAKCDLQRARVEAQAGLLSEAAVSLARAQQTFSELGATGQIWRTRLYAAQIALGLGDSPRALLEAEACRAAFDSERQLAYAAEARLLEANALAEQGKHRAGAHAAQDALLRARQTGIPELRHDAHMLRGRIAEAEGMPRIALRAYGAASMVRQHQLRDLTVTLRPAFMSGRIDAQRALARLQLAQGMTETAFETVERGRAQALHTYLSERDALRWPSTDQTGQQLIAQLDALRQDYRETTDDNSDPDGHSPARQARRADLERRMRDITEHLYLLGGRTQPRFLRQPPSVAQLQRALGADEALLTYFDDGPQLHAFTLSADGLRHCALGVSSAQVYAMVASLQRNISRASAVSRDARGGLNAIAGRLCRALYDALWRPVAKYLAAAQRVYVVPGGPLFALPINALHNGKRYLIETHELVTLPSADALTHRPVCCARGVRVLVDDHGGRLRATHAEGHVLRDIFGSEVLIDESGELGGSDGQMLHIAAHGVYRADAPDFSHIALCRGNVYLDDLLQRDFAQALVTLSACETGRSPAVAHDDVLGLSWAFLYAGAGAVIASLWRVEDDATLQLMTDIYTALRRGVSKARALCLAQRAVLERDPDAHPAEWGAFQLTGDPSPLNSGI
jgi:CHAT domain-containing protein